MYYLLLHKVCMKYSIRMLLSFKTLHVCTNTKIKLLHKTIVALVSYHLTGRIAILDFPLKSHIECTVSLIQYLYSGTSLIWTPLIRTPLLSGQQSLKWQKFKWQKMKNKKVYNNTIL